MLRNIFKAVPQLQSQQLIRTMEEMSKQGKKVYKFAIEQSPLPLIEMQKQATIKNAFHKEYGIVQGLLELRQGIAKVHNTKFKTNFNEAQVILGPSVKELLFYLNFSVVENFQYTTPCTQALVNHPQLILNKKPKVIHSNFESKFKLSASQIETSVKQNKGFDFVVLSNPTGFSGQCYTQPEIKSIAESAKKNNYHLIEAQGLSELAYEKFNTASLHNENTIVVSSISQWLNCPGYKIAYMLVPTKYDHLRKSLINHASESYSVCSMPIQYGVVPVFQNYFENSVQSYVATGRKIYQGLTKWAYQTLKNSSSKINILQPQAGMTVYFNLQKFKDILASKFKITNSTELAKKIANDTGVFVLPDSDQGRGDLKEFGCTISLVDFDANMVLKNISTSAVDEKFIKNNCVRIYDGVNKLGAWIKQLEK